MSWLLFLREYGFGACLADDMGLGKTIQLISYMLAVREKNGPASSPALIVCPTSVLGNWQKELERFAPDFKVHLHYGSGRKKGEAFTTAFAGTDVVLTSYGLLHQDEEEFLSSSPGMRSWGLMRRKISRTRIRSNPAPRASCRDASISRPHRHADGKPPE